MYNVLIQNGFILDGTGNPGFYGDIAVKDGKIAAVASHIQDDAEQIIGASGMTVCPGFIDPHVHEELPALQGETFECFLRQGITTTVNGNCGHSLTPLPSGKIYEYMKLNGLISAEAEERFNMENPAWQGLSGYAEVMKKRGVNLNMAFLLGHGTIRWCVMGGSKDRKATLEEETAMHKAIRRGMEEGAVGLSTGLAYIPGRYADTQELIDCAKIVGEMDGVYASHLRVQLGHVDAIREAIEIGKDSGARVQVSHYPPNQVEGFREAMRARDSGLEIAIDTIPKSSGHLKRKDRLIQFILSASSVLFGKGLPGFYEALKTEEGRQEILRSTRFRDQLIVVNTGDPLTDNKSLMEIARARGISADDLLLEYLEHGPGNLTFWQGGMNRGDFPGGAYPEEVARCPIVSAGSDRIFGELFDPTAWYELFRRGAFPIFFDNMKKSGVRPEETVRRVTCLPAQQFRFTDRGSITCGKAADITVLDMNEFSYPGEAEADYLNPRQMASGVDTVLVNGEAALLHGVMQDNKAGKLISMYGRTL
jgi:N-acyl-D-amino-acid deacylase